MELLLSIFIGLLITASFVYRYVKQHREKAALAFAAIEKGKQFSQGPRAQHPRIDTDKCIGCGACTRVCPEGDVLAMVSAKAMIVKGYKCIGHSLCAEACPVGAIEMVMASPSMCADIPVLTEEHETNVSDLFIVGELGGLALIKNAVNQGRDCIDTIAERLSSRSPRPSDTHDVLIVGAGPAGISASLRAIEKKLVYVTLEQDEIGGTVAKYPRQKLVMTSPVQFPMHGKFKKMELSKENLLVFWDSVMKRADFRARTGERVDSIQRDDDGIFNVTSNKARYRTRAVILALGRTGTPRKLGVAGEELPKVMYRLIEADHYTNKKILIVGGGDSAIEAALGLSAQSGNRVTLSYRQAAFSRIKERNEKRIEEAMHSGKVEVFFSSNVKEIKPDCVLVDVSGGVRELANDFVWVFAGGIPPYDLLRKSGVRFGHTETGTEAVPEAKQIAPGGILVEAGGVPA
jgi:thioredoxin reductase/Pyruvate/2-oxoacid:ferredoxin oxidoreductase delta subunit